MGKICRNPLQYCLFEWKRNVVLFGFLQFQQYTTDYWVNISVKWEVNTLAVNQGEFSASLWNLDTVMRLRGLKYTVALKKLRGSCHGSELMLTQQSYCGPNFSIQQFSFFSINQNGWNFYPFLRLIKTNKSWRNLVYFRYLQYERILPADM